MADLTKSVGLQLPLELRRWWSWHNGAQADALAVEREMGPGLVFLPLAEAVEQCLFERELAREFGNTETDREFWWRTSWFPITYRGGAVAGDCSDSETETTPIYAPFSHDIDAPGRTQPAARSFGEVIEWWVEAFEDGIWQYDESSRTWKHRFEQRPRGRERLV